MNPWRVLVVCTGNTCRSPMAVVVLKHRAMEASLNCEVDSAGTSAERGNPATKLAIEAAKNLELDLRGHRAKMVEKQMMDWADTVLVMTPDHKSCLIEMFAPPEGKVHTLHEYTGSSGEISDPIGGTRAQYDNCISEIDRLVSLIVAQRVQRQGLP